MTTVRPHSISTARTHLTVCPYCGTPNLACDHYVGPDDSVGNQFVFEMSLKEAAASYEEYKRSAV